MTDLMLVKSDKRGAVGLWEVHPDHPYPGGEVFVKDDPVLVAMTPAVMSHIRRGLLVHCTEPTVETLAENLKASVSVLEIDGIGPKTTVALSVLEIETIGQLAGSGIDHPLVVRWRDIAREMITN